MTTISKTANKALTGEVTQESAIELAQDFSRTWGDVLQKYGRTREQDHPIVTCIHGVIRSGVAPMTLPTRIHKGEELVRGFKMPDEIRAWSYSGDYTRVAEFIERLGYPSEKGQALATILGQVESAEQTAVRGMDKQNPTTEKTPAVVREAIGEDGISIIMDALKHMIDYAKKPANGLVPQLGADLEAVQSYAQSVLKAPAAQVKAAPMPKPNARSV